MSKKSRRERKAGFSVPYSGQILGSLVDAIKLDDSVLTGKTAKRFFASGNASEYKKREVFRELGQVLVDLGLVPDVDEKLPGAGRRRTRWPMALPLSASGGIS